MRYSKTKETIIASLILFPLFLGGCGTCETGPECRANADRLERIIGQGTRGLGDVVEAGGDLTGDVLHLLGVGADRGGDFFGDIARKGGEKAAEFFRPFANFPQAIKMGIQEAYR